MPIEGNNNGATENSNEIIVPQIDTPTTDTPLAEDITAQAEALPEASKEIPGLTQAEITDPNKIIVTIPDRATPIVILYGPPSCGKTMTLVRLARYLRSKGYRVNPDRAFRPKNDKNFQRMCDDFDATLNSNQAAKSTQFMSFMLVKVLDSQARPVCQILEAPGELYFNGDPKKPYPTYVHSIIASPNRKVWAIMVEPDWDDVEKRANYVTRIRDLKSKCSFRDKYFFMLNKVDLTPYVRNAGNVNTQEAIRYTQNMYPNMFVPFENQNPITRFFNKYNCEFIPFMTGSYTETEDGDFMYVEGPEVYAQNLWNKILKYVKG